MAPTLITSSVEESFKLLAALGELYAVNGLEAVTIPPAATEPGYVPPNRGNVLLITNITLMVVTLLVVLLRYYSRMFVAGGLGRDDLLIFLAMVVVIGQTGMNSYGVKRAGIGEHFYDINLDKVREMLEIVYALPIVYSFGVLVIKASILFYYKRLFGNRLREQRIVNYFLIFLVCFTIGSIFTYAFICKPVQGWWVLEIRAESCPTFKKTMAIYVSLRAVTVVCDIVVLLIPMPMVWQLKIPLGQKLGLAAVFGLGILACGVAVARLSLLPNLLLNMDVPWSVLDIAILDQAEMCIGILTSCIPALTALYARYRGMMSNRSYRSSTHGSIELQKPRPIADSTRESVLPFGRKAERNTSQDGGLNDFLSFAYDPDRQNVVYTTAYYGGKRKGNKRSKKAKCGLDSVTNNDSDEQLVVENQISKTTEVTVDVNFQSQKM